MMFIEGIEKEVCIKCEEILNKKGVVYETY